MLGLGLLLALLALSAAVGIGLSVWRAGRVRARLFADEVDEAVPVVATQRLADRSRLEVWLERAGHRGAHPVATFLLACGLFSLMGVGAVAGLLGTGLANQTAGVLLGLPVLGAGLGFFVRHSPWLIGLAIASIPITLVRRDRARRVASIEQDLPLVIELLATFAEAGLGFESAMAEVVNAQPQGRPLREELRRFQLEVSTGERRSDGLRRLAERIDLPASSAFVAALIHGEETGSSIAGLLRPQAREVRRMRRERALARAEALPEKLVVPLLLGFLPGLLVWTLGPAFFQLFEMLDAALGQA